MKLAEIAERYWAVRMSWFFYDKFSQLKVFNNFSPFFSKRKDTLSNMFQGVLQDKIQHHFAIRGDPYSL